jgi:hypothetical protein
MYKIIGADQKEYGPVSADQLRQWIAEGRVDGRTKVQPDGSTDWKTVAELAEFAGVLPPAPSLSTPPLHIPAIPAQPRHSPMAVWAMAVGIFSVLCCQFLGPVAIVLGAVALSQLKSHPELAGRGFAVTGIALGIVSLLMAVAVALLLIFSPDFMQSFQRAMQQ